MKKDYYTTLSKLLANFSEILKGTYFEEHLQTAASVMNSYIVKYGSVTDIFLRFFQNI